MQQKELSLPHAAIKKDLALTQLTNEAIQETGSFSATNIQRKNDIRQLFTTFIDKVMKITSNANFLIL